MATTAQGCGSVLQRDTNEKQVVKQDGSVEDDLLECGGLGRKTGRSISVSDIGVRVATECYS